MRPNICLTWASIGHGMNAVEILPQAALTDWDIDGVRKLRFPLFVGALSFVNHRLPYLTGTERAKRPCQTLRVGRCLGGDPVKPLPDLTSFRHRIDGYNGAGRACLSSIENDRQQRSKAFWWDRYIYGPGKVSVRFQEWNIGRTF
jgi:hypothetical protein